MELRTPLFSIAVVTFQQRHLLNECLKSIFIQTYPNIELIICDDESCDFDVEEVTDYILKNKKDNIKNIIIYKQKSNVGTTANCQKALELSSGELFKLQAGDDMLMQKDVLEKISKYFSSPSTNIIATIAQASTHDGQLVQDYYPPIPNFIKAAGSSPAQLFRLIGTEAWGAYICAPAVFWRRSILVDFGGFDKSYKFTEDWPLWLKICQQKIQINYISEVTMIYRYGGISNAQSELNKSLGRIHYYECIRLLKEIAMPVFLKDKTWFACLRCWFSIKKIEARIVYEMDWKNYCMCQKIGWKIKSMPFLICSKIFAIRNRGELSVTVKPFVFAWLVGIICFCFDITLYPTWPSKTIWGILFLIMTVYLALLVVLKALIKLIILALDVRIHFFNH